VRELAFHDEGAQGDAARLYRPGKGDGHHSDDHRDPRREQDPDPGRREEGRRGIQPDRGDGHTEAGIQQGLHNEGFEVSMVDGKRTYDVLLELLDPKLVKFQFQMSTIKDGFDAADYFTKYPGRFFSMHLQDWNPENRTAAALGKGSIDWKRVFTAAKTGGVKNYFVEQNMDMTKESVAFLKSLNV
jgi:hypothetical protein